MFVCQCVSARVSDRERETFGVVLCLRKVEDALSRQTAKLHVERKKEGNKILPLKIHRKRIYYKYKNNKSLKKTGYVQQIIYNKTQVKSVVFLKNSGLKICNL